MAASREPFNVTGEVHVASSTSTPPSSSVARLQSHYQSSWHSPVPYLFGGLAAMLGLIAFALLILACSYWKLSGYLEGAEQGSENRGGGDIESGNSKNNGGGGEKKDGEFEEKILVIMAGQVKPTYLATPTLSCSSSFNSSIMSSGGASSSSTSRSSSFGDHSNNNNTSSNNNDALSGEDLESNTEQIIIKGSAEARSQ